MRPIIAYGVIRPEGVVHRHWMSVPVYDNDLKRYIALFRLTDYTLEEAKELAYKKVQELKHNGK